MKLHGTISLPEKMLCGFNGVKKSHVIRMGSEM